jgi:fluoride ion exporter CrcB/FEX
MDAPSSDELAVPHVGIGGLVAKYEFLSADARLFLFTGIAGGFTTFSAFGLEAFYLLRKGQIGIAAACGSVSSPAVSLNR